MVITNRYRCLSLFVVIFTSLACQRTDKGQRYWGSLAIEAASVNGSPAMIVDHGSALVLKTPRAQLLIRPLWVLDGMDIILKLEPESGQRFRLDTFDVRSARLDERGQQSGSRKAEISRPYYFQTDPSSGRHPLNLPLWVENPTWVGLSAGLRPDEPSMPHTFKFMVLWDESTYAVELLARRPK